MDHCTELEQDLIRALSTRHSAEARDAADPTVLNMGNDPELNVAFAEAMAPLYEKYAGNLDVTAIYVEALMNLKAWQLWDKNTATGEITPADDNTLLLVKIMEVYELEKAPQNFGFYVHGRGHSVAHESRELIYGWMDTHLKPPEVTKTRLVATEQGGAEK